jgi:DNA modification methylase
MNKLIHGNCALELKRLPAYSIDLVCTDPPIS